MKIVIDTDIMENDAKGEALRELVFADEYHTFSGEKYKDKGCYGTFNTKPEFEKIDPKQYPKLCHEFSWDFENDNEVYAVESNEMVAMWAWDGDGTLLVYIKGENTYLVNYDCKCSYGWREIETALNNNG